MCLSLKIGCLGGGTAIPFYHVVSCSWTEFSWRKSEATARCRVVGHRNSGSASGMSNYVVRLSVGQDHRIELLSVILTQIILRYI